MSIMLDLNKALKNVENARKRNKKSENTKMWFEVFDELYLDRVNKGGKKEIINIILEHKHVCKYK